MGIHMLVSIDGICRGHLQKDSHASLRSLPTFLIEEARPRVTACLIVFI